MTRGWFIIGVACGFFLGAIFTVAMTPTEPAAQTEYTTNGGTVEEPVTLRLMSAPDSTWTMEQRRVLEDLVVQQSMVNRMVFERMRKID